MPLARQETGLNLFRLAEGQVDPIGRPDLTLYKGTCHCGRNRFEVHLRQAQITNAAACNCSLCHKAGYLWAFPGVGDINYYNTTSKSPTLRIYETEALKHQFCTSCGTGLYGTHKAGPLEGQPGINVRSLLGINPFDIKPERTDTAATIEESPVELPPALLAASQQLQGGENDKTYTGSCQCGAVSFAVKAPLLSEVEVKEDNCSICVRRAATTIFPDKDQVIFLPGHTQDGDGKEDHAITTYAFGRKFNQFPFCKTCGVACHIIPLGPPQEVVSKLPAEKQQFVEQLRRLRPLYLRAMNGVDWDGINILKSDEGTEGYVVRFDDGVDI